MTLQDMITRFQMLLNRDDCSDDQATIFLMDAIARIQRQPQRLPCMEKIVTFTTASVTPSISVPSDLLSLVDVTVPGSDGNPRSLKPQTLHQLYQLPTAGDPCAYARFGGNLLFRGSVPAGVIISIFYHGEFAPFASLSDSNEISTAAPDLVIYGGLSFAGDAYEHPAADKWEARFQAILGEVAGLANDADMTNGPLAVASMYPEE